MDAEKIKVCMISISDSPSALENLKRVVSSCIDPPLILSTVFSAVSDRQKVQEALEDIDRLKPQLIFVVLSSGHFEQAEFLVNSLQEEGLKPVTLAFLEDPISEIMIDLLKLGITDVISPPYTPENVVPRIWRILIEVEIPTLRVG